MTKDQIEAIFERVRTWPPARQEDAAAILLRLEQEGTEEYELTEEERADLDAAELEAERAEFATDEEVRALFARYRHG